MSYERARARMIEEQLVGRGIADPRVLAAMARVERHRFVEEALEARAYDDKPLPIGARQTISQPFMVGLMTEALGLRGTERVLEIGTGCGYQTAVLAELVANVFSVERISTLATAARQLLDRLGYYNVAIRVGDGTLGWSDEAPFDAIVVTAGTPQVPRPLITQLADGGRLVFPIGEEELQTLVRIRKEGSRLHEEYFGDCRFVKLVGRYGWER
ncbi:MAG: protein-L-isoaspartate(D-aspartate) O-methyltransferase [Deltaproteobacteria bacterium]|nr:protein-L-isoaspartate(D-aspartate) O-methyltransferase [Deltaproteobacteria bacterium]